MLQIGDVDFDTAAGDDYNFIFAGVAEPADVVHMVDQATGRPRRHRAASATEAQRAPSRTPRPELRGALRPALRRALLGEPGRLAQRVGAVGALPGEVARRSRPKWP